MGLQHRSLEVSDAPFGISMIAIPFEGGPVSRRPSAGPKMSRIKGAGGRFWSGLIGEERDVEKAALDEKTP